MNAIAQLILRLRHTARCERGTQLVELAIVLPVMLMMLGATAEFGRFLYTYSTLAKATRDGARYLASASVNSANDTGAKNLVVCGDPAAVCSSSNNILSGLQASNVQITRAGGVPVLPQTVTVRITGYRYQPLFDLGKLIGSQSLSLNIDVSPSTTMRFLLTQPSV